MTHRVDIGVSGLPAASVAERTCQFMSTQTKARRRGPAGTDTALITLCKPFTMADNRPNKQEDGHAGHRRSGSSL